MTLQQIYYALITAESGSMNKAAKKLYISQPTLTSAMKEMEQEAGIQIFLRTSKGISLTNEGREFLMYARQVYQQYELLQDKYGEKGSRKRKFGVSIQHYSFAVKAFVEMVKKFGTLKYEFAIRETKTYDLIRDVATSKSEIGILFLSNFNRKILSKILNENDLEFHGLIDCDVYVYLWKNHPLADRESITIDELQDYPCMSFEQGEEGSFYLAEEILSENDYQRTIKVCDRATMLNLMVGLNGYTLCSGIICQELNGTDYIAVPFQYDEGEEQDRMQIGYIVRKHSILGEIGEAYIAEVRKYFEITAMQDEKNAEKKQS